MIQDSIFPFLSFTDTSRPEQLDFVKEIRRSAVVEFEKTGFPDTNHENWKYTPVNRYLPNKAITDNLKTTDLSAAISIPFSNIDAYQIIILNGESRRSLASSSLPEGIEFISILEALKDPELSSYFNQLGKSRKDGFSLSNAADFDRGYFLRLKKGIKLEKPLHLVHIFSGSSSSIIQTRNLIIVEKLSEMILLETYINTEEENNSITDIFFQNFTETYLEEGSILEQIQLQNLGKESRGIFTNLIKQNKNSVYRSNVYSLKGKMLRNNLQVELSESFSEAHLYGFYSIHNNELMDNHTLVKHLMPNCQSNELYKGVLDGKSVGVFNGRVEVSQDAQKTNAYQQNQTILLGEEATMNSKPELEIFADDVKCSHGSTMGQMDSSALFYLKSRGISEKTAQKMMINAFAFSLLNEISNSEIKQGLIDLINQENS